MAPSLPWPGSGQPHLLAFDVTNPAAPTVGDPMTFGVAGGTLTDVKVAASGLVVVGVDQWRDRVVKVVAPVMSVRPVKLLPSFDMSVTKSELVHSVQVIDVPANGIPGARSLIDLPGSLFAVSQLGRDGFLAYTRTLDDKGGGAFQVSACDGRDAFQVAQMTVPTMGSATADDRILFYGTQKGIARCKLADSGKFISDGLIASKWVPAQIRIVDGQLLATDWRRLLAAPVDGKSASESWTFTLGFTLGNVQRSGDGAWIVPMGDYGFELASP
jgi:hypothetical protein